MHSISTDLLLFRIKEIQEKIAKLNKDIELSEEMTTYHRGERDMLQISLEAICQDVGISADSLPEVAPHDYHASIIYSRSPNTNSGHGHVWRRPDGLKARCGGLGFCNVCKLDQQVLNNVVKR